MLPHVYPARIRDAAQGGSSGPVYTKTGPVKAGFSMHFCCHVTGGPLRAFSAWRYKHSSRGRFAVSGPSGGSRIGQMDFLRPGPGFFGGSGDFHFLEKTKNHKLLLKILTFFDSSASPRSWICLYMGLIVDKVDKVARVDRV